jgi:chromosome partitioning protein
VRISVINQKGGVGKSTTTANLAVVLARDFHRRVLVIDWDAQANASAFLGLGEAPAWGNTSLVLEPARGFHPARDVLVEGLDVVPGCPDFALVERQLLGDLLTGPRRLRRALEPHFAHYDVVLTDCGPTLGMLAINAVAACPDVLVPIELAHAAALGALTLQRFLSEAQANLEASIRTLGVLPTFHDDRERTPREVLVELSRLFGDALFKTAIHSAANVRDAGGQGRPVVLTDPHSRGAAEYRALAQEVVTRG